MVPHAPQLVFELYGNAHAPAEAASEPPGRGAPALRAEAAAHGGHAEAQLVVTPGRGEAPVRQESNMHLRA